MLGHRAVAAQRIPIVEEAVEQDAHLCAPTGSSDEQLQLLIGGGSKAIHLTISVKIDTRW